MSSDDRISPARRSLRVLVLLLTGLLSASGLAYAETLVGDDIRLEQGALRAARDPRLRNAAETLHIEGPVLGQTEAGRSTGPSGLTLQGGLAPVPVPEPGAAMMLVGGALTLLALERRRTSRSRENTCVSIRGPLS